MTSQSADQLMARLARPFKCENRSNLANFAANLTAILAALQTLSTSDGRPYTAQHDAPQHQSLKKHTNLKKTTEISNFHCTGQGGDWTWLPNSNLLATWFTKTALKRTRSSTCELYCIFSMFLYNRVNFSEVLPGRCSNSTIVYVYVCVRDRNNQLIIESCRVKTSLSRLPYNKAQSARNEFVQ